MNWVLCILDQVKEIYEKHPIICEPSQRGRSITKRIIHSHIEFLSNSSKFNIKFMPHGRTVSISTSGRYPQMRHPTQYTTIQQTSRPTRCNDCQPCLVNIRTQHKWEHNCLALKRTDWQRTRKPALSIYHLTESRLRNEPCCPDDPCSSSQKSVLSNKI